MSTGNFTNWAGDITQIGPIYPFVGTEVPLVIVGVVLWLGWHWWQIKEEKRIIDEALKSHDNKAIHEIVSKDEGS